VHPGLHRIHARANVGKCWLIAHSPSAPVMPDLLGAASVDRQPWRRGFVSGTRSRFETRRN
jgi:hypothetical protein